ncbi:type II toxin-antitoxin system HipA family toxin [Sphingobacterium sp. lm-10]|uniref:type II toxin-antitoxin system HipA family toxin n=1 Tax=Sphingobacterium sp. lm-10 TaxID=2944904 RepID=UPI0020208F90|nr:HipA domain-containing protein [Sphingobacterium sp. lm-10]MCL7986437.1 type II toxin-antitoxin system HipA family toxin [Sphingobacterium sp. lm-10]
MVKTAFVKLRGKRIAAVAWDEKQQLGFFEYDKRFAAGKLEVAPIKMPLSSSIYSFSELRNTSTFKGLPGLLADSLPDRYGNELINIWLARNGRPENSLNPVELLCFIGSRGMGALEFEPTTLSRANSSHTIALSSLIDTTIKLLESKEHFETHTDHDMQDVLLDVLKMGTSAGGARPKAIIAYNETARNCDDHTKNFAFIMEQDGKWKLAPAYDICYAYRPESDWVSQHNLSINGKRKDFVKSDLLTMAKQNSIRNPEAIITEVMEIVNKWPKYAKTYHVEEKLAKAIDSTLIRAI